MGARYLVEFLGIVDIGRFFLFSFLFDSSFRLRCWFFVEFGRSFKGLFLLLLLLRLHELIFLLYTFT